MLVLAAQSRKLDGIERLVNKLREGCDDVVLVVSDRVHTAEEKGLVSDDIKSIRLRDGNLLAETEVEVIVILIRVRVGVEMRGEERGEVGQVDRQPRLRPACNILDDSSAGFETVHPGDEQDTAGVCCGH
jgi:hypothetical protein